MTPEAFNELEDVEKSGLVFDANKLDEKDDEFITYSLFSLDGFYVEVKTSKERLFKKIIKGYSLKDLPLMYTGNIMYAINR
jgi:hypothetical protein